MWSVIVRLSITGETDSKIRNKVVSILESLGMTTNQNTASWKIDCATPTDAANKLSEVLIVLADPLANVTNANPSAHMDHLWIYIERTN